MIIMSFSGQLCSLVGNSHQNSMRICGINILSVFLCGQVVLNIPVIQLTCSAIAVWMDFASGHLVFDLGHKLVMVIGGGAG